MPHTHHSKKIQVHKENDTIIIQINNHYKINLSVADAYGLIREIGRLLGLRVSLGKPIVSYRIEPTHFVVFIIEGRGAKEIVIPKLLVNAYIKTAQKLGKGRYDKRDFAHKAFIEAFNLGITRVSKYLTKDGLNWELMFGNRQDYYELFRGPVLLLEKIGLVQVKRQYIEVLNTKPLFRTQIPFEP